MVELVAKRYAKALMDIDSGNKIDGFIDVLDGLSSALAEPKAKEIIASPLISIDDKVSLLLEGLGKSADPILVELMKLMGEKGRLGLIPELTAILKFEKKKDSNSFTGRVESRKKLDATELKSLEDALSRHSASEIKLEQVKSDLNGVKVEVEDLGLELNFSKDRIKIALLDYIQKAL
ncbi:MAG: F0F1 ATP synthase subunit delta [Sulfurovum sp.]|nr:F0F1 ATP synthase subunit delta [Sulfurovum sp.]